MAKLVNRIFLVLALGANLCLVLTFWLGWRIEDAASLAPSARQQVSLHFLAALGSILLALMVHAVVLTYFMGTGRWIEETCTAYGFEETARKENIRLKYVVISGMALCMLLLIVTGAFGAIADPASNMKMSAATTIHFSLATLTLLGNIAVSLTEYQQIVRNSTLVDLVYQRVLQVRREHGLDTAAPRT